MDILCASDQKFAAHTAAMLASVCAHNNGVTAHWICSGLTPKEMKKAGAFFADRGLKICFYSAPKEVAECLPVDKHASAANYFRLFAPSLLPDSIGRIIYIDSDVIVRKNLAPLWQHNMADASVAAVCDPSASLSARRLNLCIQDYFNSGVMLLDFERWRRDGLSQKVLDFILSSPEKIVYWDQDGLNGVLRGHWSRLPITWNVAHYFFLDPDIRDIYSEEIKDPAIVHFSGQNLKPWQYSLRHPFKHEYQAYRRNTPWPYFREDGAPTIMQKAKAHLQRIACLRFAKDLLRRRKAA